MLAVGKILYATDFSSCSLQALPHAVFLARDLGAALHVFHALVPHWERLDLTDLPRRTAEEVLLRLEERAAADLDELLAGIDLGEVAVEKVLRRDRYAGSMILAYAEAEGIDLVVLGTHGRRGPGRLLLGSVAEEVLRLARCPVLTVRELEEPRPASAVERILVPVDFSDHSQQALRYGRELAARYRARLQLLHVVQQVMLPGFYIPGAPGIFPQNLGALEATAVRSLEELMAEPGPEVPYEAHVVTAPPAMGIVDFAAGHGSDLIVIATHGLTGLDRLLAGSTAEGVTRMARCPVFTVRSFGKQLLRPAG